MRALAIAVAVATAASAAAPAFAAAKIHVYSVDLRRAVLATPDGRAVKATLEQMRRAQVEQIRTEERELRTEKPRLTPEQYRARYQALQERIATAESKLEAAQDNKLAPLLGAFRKLMRAAEAPSVAVLDISVEAPVDLDERCDRTAQLVAAYSAPDERQAPTLGPPADACRVDGLLYVQVDRVVKALPESRQALAALDALQRRRQTELDTQRQRLAELQQRARMTGDRQWRQEAAQRARQLDESYRAFQREIRDAEHEAQARLYRKVEQALKGFRAEHPGFLFVEHFEDGPIARPRACEVTDWVTRRLGTGAGLAALKKVCDWVR